MKSWNMDTSIRMDIITNSKETQSLNQIVPPVGGTIR